MSSFALFVLLFVFAFFGDSGLIFGREIGLFVFVFSGHDEHLL